MVLSSLLLVLSLTLFGGQAWGLAAQYTVTDLGASVVMALDKDDTVAVGSVIGTQQLAYELSPTLRSLGTLPGGAWSEATGALKGQIVGQSSTGTNSLLTHAFLYTQGVMQDLGTLGGAPLFSAATSVSRHDVCGFADNLQQDKIVPVCWIKGRILEYATLGGEDGYVDAVNDSGTAVGNARTATGETHCALWPVQGGVVDCHGPQGGTLSYGKDLNKAGLVVGVAFPKDAQAFLFMPWGMILLPPFAQDTRSAAHSINDAGTIVGESSTAPACGTCGGVQHAVAWVNGTPVDLQPRLVNAAGWRLTSAVGINNADQIIVRGTLNGVPHSALLSPVGMQKPKPHKGKNAAAIATR